MDKAAFGDSISAYHLEAAIAFYLYHSLLGEIYSRLNNPVEAKKRFESAIKLTQSETERKLLQENCCTAKTSLKSLTILRL